MGIDFRKCLNALSDVIINRPPPLRVFDQIYMKLPDMLLQAELIARRFDGKDVVFIGDGDAIALSVAHLNAQQLLNGGPKSIHVLDFDERIVNSIQMFAGKYNIEETVSASLYNVADQLPQEHWHSHDAFYTNPPWGCHNEGESVRAFIERGIECVAGPACGCVVIGDHESYRWTHSVLLDTQRFLLSMEFRVAEMLPSFHHYHLDDSPELTSCAMFVSREGTLSSEYASKPLGSNRRKKFYGRDNPLKIRYIRDCTNAGKLATRDVEMESYPEADE